MALNLPTFYKRTASAVIFAAIMLTGLLWNDGAFVVLACLIQMLCLRDYFRLVPKIDTITRWPKWVPVVIQAGGIIWTVLLAYNVLFIKNGFTDHPLLYHIAGFMWAYACIFLVILIFATTLSKKTGWRLCIQSFGGILYIVMPVSLLLLLRGYHHFLPLVLILMIWTNDTMAYLVGSFIGKHRFSNISPNKTWEGVIGGAVLTITGAGIFGYFSSIKNSTHEITNWVFFAIIGSIVAVSGTLGDLLESKFKRLAGVKDSGTLMPGHGGALDRFDSLLVVIPFVYCTILILSSGFRHLIF